jgi:hypothetical protein
MQSNFALHNYEVLMSTTNLKKSAPKLDDKTTKQVVALPTVSSKIRFLDEQGMSRGDIARYLNKRYQHVKNVLDRPLKKA